MATHIPGFWRCLLHIFDRTPRRLEWNPLCDGMPKLRDPLPTFSEARDYIGREFIDRGALYQITEWKSARWGSNRNGTYERDTLDGDGEFHAVLVLFPDELAKTT